jgi:hypothetical protein
LHSVCIAATKDPDQGIHPDQRIRYPLTAKGWKLPGLGSPFDFEEPDLPFQNERQMHASLIAVAQSMASTADETWVFAMELPAATRIPDLVAARIHPRSVELRLELGLTRPIALSGLKAITMLSRRTWKTPDEIAAVLGVTASYLRRTLHFLLESGYVESKDGAFRLHSGYLPVVSKCISFEAKRSDWRNALTQARAHLAFANSSYVVFDSAFEARFRRARPYFQTAQVGLVSLSEDGGFDRLLGSRTSRTNAFERAALNESLFGRMLGLPKDPLPETRLPNAEAPSVDQQSVLLAGRHSRRFGHLIPAAVFV